VEISTVRKRLVSAWIVLAFVVGGFSGTLLQVDKINDGEASASTLDTFKGNTSSYRINFTTPGTNNQTVKIEISSNSTVLNATMKIKGEPYGSGNYPSNVSVNIGEDGDVEWAFNGTGYGSLGKQEYFSDSTPSKLVNFNSTGSADVAFIKIPKNANVTSAYIDLQPTGLSNTQYPMNKPSPAGWSTNNPIGVARGLKFQCMTTGVFVTELGCVIPPPYASGQRWLTLWDFSTQQKLAQVQVPTPMTGGVWNFVTLTTPVALTQNSYYIVCEWGTGYYYKSFPSGYPSPWCGDSNIVYSVLQYKNTCTKDTFPSDTITTMIFGIPDIGYTTQIAGPENVSLYIGPNDTSPDWEHPGVLDVEQNTTNLSTAFNMYISLATPTGTDTYGNSYVDVPLNLSSSANSSLVLNDMAITYDYEAIIDIKPNGSLVSELNQFIPTVSGENINITVAIHSDSQGKILLYDLNITYNIPPWFDSNLPTGFQCYEDTYDSYLFNISTYACDDNDDPLDLTFDVLQLTHFGVVNVFIIRDHWLGIDPSMTPNWNSETQPGGLIEVKIYITDSHNRTVLSPLIKINVLPVNDEPLPQQNIPDLIIFEGGTDTSIVLNEGFYFSDVEGDILYYGVGIDPKGLNPTGASNISVDLDFGSTILTVTGLGDYFTIENEVISLWLYADDDLDVNTIEDGYLDPGETEPDWVHQEINITLLNENDPPTIIGNDLTDAYEDQQYVYDYDVIDVDHDNPVFEWTLITNASWLDIDASSGNLSGTPTSEDIGHYNVKVSVTDRLLGYDFREFELIVHNTNDVPVWIDLPIDAIIQTDVTYAFDVNATDIDPNDQLTFDIHSSPESSIIIGPGTGVIQWTPKKDAIGIYNLNLSVTDDKETVYYDYTIEVISVFVNTPPTTTLISPADGLMIEILNPVMEWTIYDPDSDNQMADLYIGINIIDIENLNPITRLGAPKTGNSFAIEKPLQRGMTYFWTVIPHDGHDFGVCTSEIWNFSIAEYSNSPPDFTSTPELNAEIGIEWTYTPTASDPDGDQVTISLTSGPEGMTFTNGVLLWIPRPDQEGQHQVKIEATDGNIIISKEFEITVLPNKPPTIGTVSDQTIDVDEPYTIQLVASDPDRDIISFELLKGPSGLNVDNNGQITWTPTKGDVGDHNIVIRITDGKEPIEVNYTLTVKDKSKGQGGSTREEKSGITLMLILIIIIVVLIALVGIMMRSKKAKAQAATPTPQVTDSQAHQLTIQKPSDAKVITPVTVTPSVTAPALTPVPTSTVGVSTPLVVPKTPLLPAGPKRFDVDASPEPKEGTAIQGWDLKEEDIGKEGKASVPEPVQVKVEA